MKRTYRWQFHFNAVHNMTPENQEAGHTHSFLVRLWMEVTDMDVELQNFCEKELQRYLAQYSGKYLNEMDKFLEKIPTIETICETLYYDMEKIVTAYGMELIQMEVGDSPVALFMMGKKLLLGGTGLIVPDELFEEYKQQINQ